MYVIITQCHYSSHVTPTNNWTSRCYSHGDTPEKKRKIGIRWNVKILVDVKDGNGWLDWLLPRETVDYQLTESWPILVAFIDTTRRRRRRRWIRLLFFYTFHSFHVYSVQCALTILIDPWYSLLQQQQQQNSGYIWLHIYSAITLTHFHQMLYQCMKNLKQRYDQEKKLTKWENCFHYNYYTC